MCKKLIASFVAVALCPMVGPSIGAQELTGYHAAVSAENYSLLQVENYFDSPDFSQAEDGLYSIEDGKGFAYTLAEMPKGASLGLFVKNSAQEDFDITGEELNAIAPAAGVRLTFDLSL